MRGAKSQFRYMFAIQVYEIKPVSATSLCSLPIIYTGFKDKIEIVTNLPAKARQYKLQ